MEMIMHSIKLFGSVLLSLFLGTGAFGDSHSTTYFPMPTGDGLAVVLQIGSHDTIGNSHHTIESLAASIDGDYLVFELQGHFEAGSHYQIFIDTDGTPTTGYSRGSIRGAEHLVEDGHLYRYPDGATGWHWGDAIRSDISTDATPTQLTVKVPLASIEMDDYIIDYAAMVLSPDWQHGHEFVAHGALDTLQNPNDNNGQVSVTYRETSKALRNPLKGFKGWNTDIVSTPYLSMYKGVVHWNDIENKQSDGVEKIIDYSNRKLFQGNYRGKSGVRVEESNIKVNPEVIIEIKQNGRIISFPPSDMDISEHDNQTDLFAKRVRKLVEKLGKAWDNDPRVGFVYVGIVGTWGEQWSTTIAPNVQKALGESFEKAFKHKKVMVRLPHYFHEKYLKRHNNWFRGQRYTSYFNNFGMYWDAFAQDGADGNSGETTGYLDTINVLRQIDVWRDQPILGEVALDTKFSKLHTIHEYPEEDKNKRQHAIDDNMQDPDAVEYLNDYIHITHATGLSYINGYNHNNPDEARGASILQKSMGYRFFIPNATYTKKVGDDKKLHLKFAVKNLGSAPFYYRWPLEVSLLDPQTKEPIWHQKVDQVDIRKWLPGDDWDMQNNHYRIPAQTYTVETDFTLPQSLEEGEYILAVAILDPAGDKPSVCFANTNYYKNGRTPLGMVGVGVDPQGVLPAFYEIGGDPGLRYDITNDDGSGTNTQNTIDSLDAESDQEWLALNVRGHFAQDAHISFFIDADNDPSTGYTRGDIIGADYLMQSTGLYRYPSGAHGWKWTKVSGPDMTYPNDNSIFVKMPLSMVDADTINFTAQVSSHDWKHNTVYPEMISYQIPQAHNRFNVIGVREIEPTPLAKGTIFASPNGDGDVCSQDLPCDITTAFRKVNAGDVLFLRGGIYHRSSQLNFSHTGTKNQPIIVESYPGEHAYIKGVTKSVTDIENPNDWSSENRPSGISIYRGQQYIIIRNIEISNFANSGIIISGSHNRIEGCNIHNNIQTGIGINGGDWHVDKGPYTRGYNLLIDNLVHDNSDVGMETGNAHTRNGGNADGIWVGSGIGNKVIHNTVYHNSDDGIDTWRSTDSYVAYNFSYNNGLGDGDGNGFKAGGVLEDQREQFSHIGLGTLMKYNIAYKNKRFGFDYNSGQDDVFEYNTAYKNRGGSFKIGRDTTIKYNIADDAPQGGTGENNSWNMNQSPEFMSTDPYSPDFLVPQRGSLLEDIGAR